MATNVTYNGIDLRNVLTRTFKQEPVRDPSNTDIWYWKFTYECETIVSASAISSSAPIGLVGSGGSAQDTPGEILKRVRSALSHDRMRFTLRMEDKVILDVVPAIPANQGGSVAGDVDNGPKVHLLEVKHVSPKLLRIVFGVQVAIIECGAASSSQTHPEVLNNRWSAVDDVDENFRTTRTWRGRLRMARARSPHDFRQLVVPPLAKGWRRKKMNFVAEPNSLELGYEVTDEEMVGPAAPSPATSMRGTHTEALQVDGTTSISELTVRLDGPRGADKREMLQRCVQIGVLKLGIRPSTGKQIIQHIALIDYFGPTENAVEFRARILRTPDVGNYTAEFNMGTMLTGTIGKQLYLPDYDDEVAEFKGPWGTSNAVTMFACFLQEPCYDANKITQSPDTARVDNATTTTGSGSTLPLATLSEGAISPAFGTPLYSMSHLENIYAFYQIDSKVVINNNRIDAPIARSNSQANQDQATVALLDLAPPTARRIIRLAAERTGDWPKIFLPMDFEALGFRHAILGSIIMPRVPSLTGDGQSSNYGIDAEYTYALHRAPRPGENMPTGALPWDSLTPAQHVLPSSAYSSPAEIVGG